MKKIISFFLCLAMCLTATSFAVSANDTLVDSGLSYLDSTELISTNPGRGQTAIGGWTVCSKDGNTKVLNPTGAYNTALFDLRAFSAGNDYTYGSHGKSGVGGKDIPINAQTLDAIAQTLANARHNGAEMAFRFAYSWDESYGNEPNDFNMMLYHIKQLSDVLNEYSDVVVAIECGMAGPWGEMHSSKYADSKYMARIIGKWLECLNDEIGLQIRAPQYMLSYYGINSSSFMALIPLANTKNFHRIGMYNDGYLGTFSDYGTFSGGSGNLSREQAAQFLKYAEYVPYGGELAYVTEEYARANSVIYKDYNIVEEFYLTHLSYLRNIGTSTHSLCVCLDEVEFTDKYEFEGMPDVSEYYGMSLRKFMYDHMGYRFVLRKSTLSQSAAPGGELRLKGKIENTGFGNVFRDKETEILLYSKGKYYSCPVELNAKTDIKSTETCEYDFTLVLPKNIPEGNYEVFMRMSNVNDDLSEDKAANIAFANEGVYQKSIGANKLGNITVSGEAVSENEYLHDKDYNVNGSATPTVVSGNSAKVEAEMGDRISLAYFVENSYDMCYYIGDNKVDTENGRAEITMSASTIGACYAVWKDAKGTEHRAEFLTLNVKGHNYAETSREEPTCIKEGKIVYTCSDCGDTVEVPLGKTAHRYSAVINDTKCASVCEVCNDSVVIEDYDDNIKGEVAYGLPAQSADGCIEIVGNALPSYTFSSPKATACFAIDVEGIGDNDALIGGFRTVTKSSTATSSKNSDASANMNYFKGFTVNGDGGYLCAFNFSLVNWDSPYNFGTISSLKINDPSVSMGAASQGLENAMITPIGLFEGSTYYNVYFCDEEGNVLVHKERIYSISASGTNVKTISLDKIEDLYTKENPSKAPEGDKVYTFKGWKTAKGDSVKYAVGTMVLVPDFEATGGECEHTNVTDTKVDATCTEDGYHIIVCNDCKEVILNETTDAPGHKIETKVLISPTYVTEGERVSYCTRCGEHVSTDYIKAVKSPFTDVKSGDWYAEAVYFAVNNGLFFGTSDVNFEPDTNMNRAMLVTVLFRLDHGSVKPDNTISKTFKDVPANQWYTGSVEWAAENGIVAGTSASTFSPLDNITREQVASILYRYARYKGYDIDASIDLSGYKDSSSISSYAVKPISWANAYGIINGVSPVKLNPLGKASRAEVAQMFRKYKDNILNDFTAK